MKNLAHALRGVTRWAIDHDDDQVEGVYATPGPRAQGDEAEEQQKPSWALSAEATSDDCAERDSLAEIEHTDN